MEYLYLTIATVIAILLVEKLTVKKAKFKPWSIAGLIFISLTISLFIAYHKRQEEKYKSDTGILDGSLNNNKIIYPAISFGGAVITQKIEDGGKARLFNIDLLVYVKNNQLFLNTTILDTDKKVIAVIVDNQWQVNTNKIFDKNFDDRAIEVKDERNRVALQAEFDGEKVNLYGMFTTDSGTHIVLYPENYNNPKMGAGILLITHKPDTVSSNLIPTLFKYPSMRHKGERL